MAINKYDLFVLQFDLSNWSARIYLNCKQLQNSDYILRIVYIQDIKWLLFYWLSSNLYLRGQKYVYFSFLYEIRFRHNLMRNAEVEMNCDIYVLWLQNPEHTQNDSTWPTIHSLLLHSLFKWQLCNVDNFKFRASEQPDWFIWIKYGLILTKIALKVFSFKSNIGNSFHNIAALECKLFMVFVIEFRFLA